MSVTVKISGLEELKRTLRELPIAVENKHLRKSVAPAADLIRQEAQRLAPVDTGRLQQSILIKRITGEDKTIATYIVVPRHGPKQQAVKKWGGVVNLDAYYWTFQEFGAPGRNVPAHPFMRPAFESLKGQALDIILNKLATGVEAEASLLSWNKAAIG